MRVANMWVGNYYRCLKAKDERAVGKIVRCHGQEFWLAPEYCNPRYPNVQTRIDSYFPKGEKLGRDYKVSSTDEFEELTQEEEMIYSVEAEAK